MTPSKIAFQAEDRTTDHSSSDTGPSQSPTAPVTPPESQNTQSPSIPPEAPRQSRSCSRSPIKTTLPHHIHTTSPTSPLQFGPPLLLPKDYLPCTFPGCKSTKIHQHSPRAQFYSPETPMNQVDTIGFGSSESEIDTLTSVTEDPHVEEERQRIAHRRTASRQIDMTRAQRASLDLQTELGIGIGSNTGADGHSQNMYNFGGPLPAVRAVRKGDDGDD